MPTTDPSQHLYATKSTFLTSQIRLLSTPLTASPSSTLPAPTVDKILTSVNKKIATQNRLVYSLESQRHIVEQVDGVYWRDVLSQGLPVGKAETVVKREVDLTEEGGGDRLPEEWDDVVVVTREASGRGVKRRRVAYEDEDEDENGDQDSADGGTGITEEQDVQYADQAARYQKLRQRLLDQSLRREQLKQKLAQYRKLQVLLKPYERPQETIQTNLVTRDNKALENELSRMRVLLARVGNAVQQQQLTRADAAQQDQAVVTDVQKLEAVLGLG